MLKNRFFFISAILLITLMSVCSYGQELVKTQCENGKYGYKDKKTGKIVIACNYDYVEHFSEGLARVKLNGKWGFINKIGEEVITCKYDGVLWFSGGLAEVQLDGKWGCLNYTGFLVVPIEYKSHIEARTAAKTNNAVSSFSFFSKIYIEQKMNLWQKKGEFESLAEWQQRVNEITINEKEILLYKESETAFLDEQTKYKKIKFSLGKYDPENESFPIYESSLNSSFWLNVPKKEAPIFKQTWDEIKFTVYFFIRKDRIAIAGVDFNLLNGETYKYTNNYSINQTIFEKAYNWESKDNITLDNNQSISTVNQNLNNPDVSTNKSTINSQDIITLLNGDVILARVTEISQSEIRYKRFDNLEGPTIVIKKSDVFAINYSNGTREVINQANSKNSTKAESYKQPKTVAGIKGGVNYTSLITNTSMNSLMKLGFQAGVVLAGAVNNKERLFSQVGLSIYSQGCNNEYISVKESLNLTYFQIPLNFQYKIGLSETKFLLQWGTYFAYAVSGKLTVEENGKKEDVKIKFGNSKNDYMKGFDMGLGAGFGVQFGNFQALVGYNYGLWNLSNVKKGLIYNNGFAFTATCMFGK